VKDMHPKAMTGKKRVYPIKKVENSK